MNSAKEINANIQAEVDRNLDRILYAAGSSALKYYIPSAREELRKVMREIMEVEAPRA